MKNIIHLLLWRPTLPLEFSEVILIKELKTSSVLDGFNYSILCFNDKHIDQDLISKEMQDDFSFHLDPDKIILYPDKLNSPLYYSELSEEDIEWFKSQKDIKNNNGEFLEVLSFKEIIDQNLLNWENLGQLFSVYFQKNNAPAK